MVLEFRNPLSITSLEKFKFQGKSLNNQEFSEQSRNVEEASKSSSGSYRYLTHTTQIKAMMERKKTRYEFKNCL